MRTALSGPTRRTFIRLPLRHMPGERPQLRCHPQQHLVFLGRLSQRRIRDRHRRIHATVTAHPLRHPVASCTRKTPAHQTQEEHSAGRARRIH